ncbi:hypothetical protein DFQ26_008914 [Actinomortierella ambigua]|nr:hypothetical protein DFQ26_008914 [Actinomortierella ambigua]
MDCLTGAGKKTDILFVCKKSDGSQAQLTSLLLINTDGEMEFVIQDASERSVRFTNHQPKSKRC